MQRRCNGDATEVQRRCNGGATEVLRCKRCRSLTEIKPGLLTKTEPACRGVAQPDSRERHRLGLKIARTPTQGSLADSVAGLEDTIPLGLQNHRSFRGSVGQWPRTEYPEGIASNPNEAGPRTGKAARAPVTNRMEQNPPCLAGLRPCLVSCFSTLMIIGNP